MFSVRIVTTDHYSAPPIVGLDVTHSEFRGNDVKRVPVLRIYGATPAGQKTCMHVHGVFPYLYVPYDGTQPWDRYLRLFAASLDKAINVANNNAKSNLQHVFKISIVSGIPMYGYHAAEQDFLKIYLYNPSSVRRAADLLLGGAVMNKPFQPHEAHIPYNLQFFIDYNLYGMNLINVSAVKFRQKEGHDDESHGKLPEDIISSGDRSSTPRTPTLGVTDSPLSRSGMNTPSRRLWDGPNIPSELFLDESVERQTSCELEVDIVAADILNRLEVDANVGNNPGLAAIWEDERQRRRDQGETSQITPPESQDREGIDVAESENLLREKLREIIDQQKAFHESESDDESNMSQGSEVDYAATPASQVDSHHSQAGDEDSVYSQDTVILEGEDRGDNEEEEEEEAVISLESIQRVLSFSQSFSLPNSQSGEGEKTLVEMLAAMADQSSPSSSQLSASQVAALEERDSVIGSQVLADEDTLKEDEEETLEMSQRIWEGEGEEEAEEGENRSREDHNMEGMDDTWSESQWFSDKEDDVIPQLDGASDEKKDVTMPERKRLGMTQNVSHLGTQNSAGFPPPAYRFDPSLYPQTSPTSYSDTSMGRPPPFSPGADRYPISNAYTGAVASRYQTPPVDGMARRNWEHEIWQQRNQMMQQTNMTYPGYQQQQQQQNFQRDYPRPNNYPYTYNQYPHFDGYGGQRTFPSTNYMGTTEQLSPPYMPNISPSSGPVPHSIAQHTMSLQSQPLAQQITPQSQHMSPPASRHGASITSQSPLNSHLSPHSISQHRPPHMSSHPMQYPPDFRVSKPSFSTPSREMTSYQQMLNSPPLGQDRSLSRSSIHSSASHMSNSSESDTSLHHHNSDHRIEDSMFDKMLNSSERTAVSSMNDLPNMTSVELTYSECSTSVQQQMVNNSHEDLFGASPQTLLDGSTPSLSVDESNESASEAMIDMTGCDDFIPGGYDSAGSDRPGSQNSFFDDRMSYQNQNNNSVRLESRRESCPSSLSGLYNLVSSVSDNSTGRPRNKLSLKRTVSDNGTSSVWTQANPAEVSSRKKIGMAPTYYPWGTNGDSSQVQNVVTNPKSFQNTHVPKRRGRPPKKKLEIQASFQPKLPDPSYTYVFHVPTPVYKRLKIRNPLHKNNQVEVVRMHPMDARRYSLLKIGTEVVRIPKLTAKDLQKFTRLHKPSISESQSTSYISNEQNESQVLHSKNFPPQNVFNKQGFPQGPFQKKEHRVPVLSQFNSYFNHQPNINCQRQNVLEEPLQLPELPYHQKHEKSSTVRKLLKDKITLFRTSLEVVQQPSRLQDILERRIQSVPNHNRDSDTAIPTEMISGKTSSDSPVQEDTRSNLETIKPSVEKELVEHPTSLEQTSEDDNTSLLISSLSSPPPPKLNLEPLDEGSDPCLVTPLAPQSPEFVKEPESQSLAESDCDPVLGSAEEAEALDEGIGCGKKETCFDISEALVDTYKDLPDSDSNKEAETDIAEIPKETVNRSEDVAEKIDVPTRARCEVDSAEERVDASKPKVPNSSSDVESNRQFQMDFSSLEDPLDQQAPVKPTDVLDSHHLLHTPPLLLESDQEEKKQPGQLDLTARKGSTSKLASVQEVAGVLDEDSKFGKGPGERTDVDNVLETACGPHTMSSGFYSDKDPSSEVDSIFSVPHSRASSRASSRKESSDSSEGAVGRSKKLKKRKSSDGYESCTSSFRYKRPSVNYSPKSFRHMFDDDDFKPDMRCKKRQKKNKRDPFKNMIVGVHYIVVGRFKGYKSMKVVMKRPKLDGHSVNVHDYFAYNLEEKRLFDRAVHRDLQRPSSAESTSTISDYLMESRIVNCKSSESEMSDAALEFPSSRPSTPCDIQEDKPPEERTHTYTELCEGGYHCSSEPLATWLEETSALHSAGAVEPVPMKKEIFDASESIQQHQFSDADCVKEKEESISIQKETPSTLDIMKDETLHEKATPIPTMTPPRLSELTSDSTSSSIVMDSAVSSQSVPVVLDQSPICQDPLSVYCVTGCTKPSSQIYSTSIHVPSSQFDNSSTDSSRDRPYKCSFVPFSKQYPRKPKIRSPHVTQKTFEEKKVKRKNLTPNQRLGVAFLSTRTRRKKANAFKLMNSLSILHQATLANLTDSVSYTDGTDDYKTKYEDVMYKLALVSPPQSDKGETSPPVPLSPEDGDKDSQLKVKEKPKPKSVAGPLEKHSPSHQLPSTSGAASGSGTAAHVSMDSIYETPLSSVENNKDSKSPELSVMWPAEPEIIEFGSEPVDISKSGCEGSMEMDIEDKSVEIKDAIVCLTPLSETDISRLTAELKKKESLSSPPYLGSPITQQPNRRYSGSSSDASTVCESNQTAPPSLTPHTSPAVSEACLYDSHNESQHSWRSDKSRDSDKHGSISTELVPQDGIIHVEIESQAKDLSSLRMCNSEVANLSHDSSSNHSKASDTSTSTDSRKENCSLKEKQHSNSQKSKGPEKSSTKYSELKLSVRNLLTPRENAINASSLPEHYDMDCPIVIRTSQYEDISSSEEDEDEEPADATRRKKKASGAPPGKKEEKPKKGSQRDVPEHLPRDLPDPSQGSSGGGSGGSGEPSPDVYYRNMVLRPESFPPTRDLVSVSAQMYGLYTTTAQNAYCSNPDDLPDKPRELGGASSRLDTNRVRDLEEFETSAGTEGLKTWRTILAANNKLFASQTVEPLWEKLDKDPGFKFMLSEDKKIAIAPCHLPPRSASVRQWYKERVAHVKLKAKAKDSGSESDSANRVPVEEYVHFCELAAEITVGESRTDDESRSPRPMDTSVSVCVEESEEALEIRTVLGEVSDSDLQTGVSEEGPQLDHRAVVQDSVEDSADASTSSVNASDDSKLLSIHLDTDECVGPSVKHKQCGSSDQDFSVQDVVETYPEERTSCDEGVQDMDTSTESLSDETVSERKGIEPSSPVKIVRMKRTLSDDGDVVQSEESVRDMVNPTATKTNNKSNSRWDQKDSNPSPSTVGADDGECSQSPVHSTPVRRRSVDWLDPLCTPIAANQNKAVAGSSSRHDSSPFVTPRKPGPVRRLSSNTEKSLRRSILASQLKSQLATPTPKRNTSQIDGPTPKNTYGFKLTQQNYQDAKALHEHQYLTAMSMEVHVETRGDLRPDPEVDAMQGIFYSIFNDIPPSKGERHITGAIIVDAPSARARERAATAHRNRDRVRPSSPKPTTSAARRSTSPSPSTSKASGPRTGTSRTDDAQRAASPKPSTSKGFQTPTALPGTSRRGDGKAASSKASSGPDPVSGSSRDAPDGSGEVPPASVDSILKKSGVEDVNTEYVKNEQELIDSFLKLVKNWDPDILIGYEIQMLSWGYVLQRATQLGIDLCTKISRTPDSKAGNHASEAKDDWASDYTSEITIVGRIVLNLWRLLRHEVTLNIYSYENVAFHVLHRRVPLYTTRTLSLWFNHRTHHHRWRVMEYYRTKVRGVLQIMEQLDLIGKTSEFARVFGIEFYHVLSRGSQYRVESMMLRLAKPMNYIPVSPRVEQRARQRAPECISLNLEPESRFYPHPVVVVDFQSLYPSIMIAYNYCFSTCLGRLSGLAAAHEGPFEFGCTSLKIPPGLLKKLEKDVTISPNGVVFLKEHLRKGVLPRMVGEILNTRIMVKKSMKGYKHDKVLSRLLDARQLGLKLIANVTYGYTGASFSGRMPCIEVADSIVRKARETLERAIKLVEDTPRWRARVVYGDTDSMFIHLEGRSKDEAFVIGQEIADSVTALFPKPIKLKFEKVYMPCVLQTKKRYVGFSYETRDQKDPVYDAKGIETVRRDTCSAVSKILERCIKLLFTTRDISQVKGFVLRQCHKFMEGKVSIQDCVFAKEFRGMMGYKPGACVPGLEIARKLIRQDRRAEPGVGERIPYVIVYGTPGMPLIQLVRSPLDVLRDPTLRINGTYYITKQILPPLHRIFSLIGINVFLWYQDMPKVIRSVPQAIVSGDTKKGTISQYFSVSNCPVCDEQTKQTICPQCMKDPQMVSIILTDRIRRWDSVFHTLAQVCHSCMGAQDDTQPCISLDCPILFRRTVAKNDVSRGEQLRQNLEKALQF